MTGTLRERVVVLLVAAVLALLFFYLALLVYGHWDDKRYADYSDPYATGYSGYTASDGSCTIAVVPVVGDILPYEGYYGQTESQDSGGQYVTGDEVAGALRAASSDPNIKGIMLRVDSYGGSAGAAYVAMQELNRAPVPTLSLIRDAGTSAAYLLASAAQRVVASPFADVGSIGVTMSYLSEVRKNEKEGLDFVALASGPYKDTGNPGKPLSDAERAKLKADIQTFRDLFVDIVAKNRNVAREKIDVLADGSSYPAPAALENGLVDALGDQESARQWFAEQLHLQPDQVQFCE